MTGDTRAETRHEGWRWRRLRDFVHRVVSAFLAPAIAVVKLVARQRARARRRLGAALTTETQRAASEPCTPDSSGGSGAARHAASSSGGLHARLGMTAKRGELFSTIRIEPEFSPEVYARTFAALQRTRSATLLDLVPARMLCADVFEELAGAWTASPDAVPRLGILLSFERWVMLRGTALAALQPLSGRGIRVEVFYAEQRGHLGAWFRHGQVVHAVPAAVATLAARWQPSASWPIVIDTLTRLVRAYTSAADLPALVTEVAGLALSCGGADEAATLAREALYYLPETASATRAKALRELGAALIGQGQTAPGWALLDQAIAMATAVKAPVIAGGALCQRALCALNRGDYPGAELRFRQAIDLLSPLPQHRHLLAQVHHHLAQALMHQGNDEATQHAQAALALRAVPFAYLAEEDRTLLAKLRELGVDVHETKPRSKATPPAPRPHASEADV